MRERVRALVGSADLRQLTVSTFHSFGLRMLHEAGAPLGLPPSFTICDESDQWSLARAALRELHGAAAARPADALRKIGLWKGAGVSPDDAAENAADDLDELLAACYRRYDEALRSRRAVDFDDLILLPVRLLREHPSVLDRYRSRFRHLLVDEFQDTSPLQYRLVRELAGARGNLCVVGDDDQSIYAFRGAEAGQILGFDRDFPGASVVTLTENYRSTQAILSLANAVIRLNPQRREKELRASLGAGAPVRLATLPDERAEADHAAALFLDLRGRGVPWRECAILFRTAAQARPFEEKLRTRRIPYLLVGGRSFYDRTEVRDLLAYLKAAVNPDDEGAVLRIVNFPPRGFGKASLEALDRLARDQGLSLGGALGAAAGCADLPARTREGAAALAQTLERTRETAAAGRLAAAAEGLLESTGFLAAIQMSYPDPLEAESRCEAVREVVESLRRHETDGADGGLPGFLSRLTLEDERPGEKDPGDRVTLMTLHAAKGLEFRHVVLAGMEDGLLPHRRSVAEELEGEEATSGIEEERRLFYVGITRARETLTLTRARKRASRGGPRLTDPSRFLGELPDGLVLRDDDRPVTPEEAQAALAQLREKLGRRR
jgi:superfamily I DNA/RNA helicase